MIIYTTSSVGDWAVFTPIYNVEDDTSLIPSYNPYNRLYQTQSQTVTGGFNYGTAAVGNFVAMGMNPISDPESTVFYDPENDVVKQFAYNESGSFGGVTAVKDFAVFQVTDYSSEKIIAHCFNPITEEGFELNYTGVYDDILSSPIPLPFGNAATVGDWAVFAPYNSPQIIAVNPYLQSTQQVTHGATNHYPSSRYAFAGPAVVGDWAVMAPRDGNVICYNPNQNDLYIHTEAIPTTPISLLREDYFYTTSSTFNTPTTVGDWVVFPPKYGLTILAFNPITRTQKSLDFDPQDFGAYLPTLVNNPETVSWFSDAATLELARSGQLKKWAIFAPNKASSPLAYDPEENVYHKFYRGNGTNYSASATVNDNYIVHYPISGDQSKGSNQGDRFFATATTGEYYNANDYNSGSDIVFELNEAGTAYILTSCGTTYVGDLEIPSIHIDEEQAEDLLPVISIGSTAFRGCINLTSVVIPDTIASIGIAAFQGCTSMTSVHIGSGITIIPIYAFQGCRTLSTITISNSVTRIRDFAFERCVSLISIENIIANITSIEDGVFENCTSLESVVIPDNVTSIGIRAFKNCSSLESIDICDYVTSIGNSAFERTNLKTVVIPEGVTKISCRLFNENTNLEEITIPDSVTSIEEAAFRFCYSLIAVTIPENVTTIGVEAFKMCTSLGYIQSLATSAPITKELKIGTDVFLGVLASGIFIPSGSTTSYQTAGDGTKYAGLELLIDTSIFELVFEINDAGTEYRLIDCPTYASGPLDIPSTHLGLPVTEVADGAFFYCSSLTSIIIPDSVTSIGQQAFYRCTSLTSINIPDSVTSIENYTFYQCTGLTSITIPDSVTSIGEGAFGECNLLADITLPNNVDFIRIENLMFNNCTSLPSITIPDSVTSIGTLAFGSCTSLPSITIPDSVTSIEESAFNSCSSLTSITIPNNVASIGTYAFLRCTGLTSITIPDSVTSIGLGAFRECENLTSATIGNSVTSIGVGVFRYCILLETIDVFVPKTVIDTATNIFLNTASPLTINVPVGTSGWVAGTGLTIGGNTNVTVNIV